MRTPKRGPKSISFGRTDPESEAANREHRCPFQDRIWFKIDGFHWFRWVSFPRSPSSALSHPFFGGRVPLLK